MADSVASDIKPHPRRLPDPGPEDYTVPPPRKLFWYDLFNISPLALPGAVGAAGCVWYGLYLLAADPNERKMQRGMRARIAFQGAAVLGVSSAGIQMLRNWAAKEREKLKGKRQQL